MYPTVLLVLLAAPVRETAIIAAGDNLELRVGSDLVAGYRHAGTVQVEKGTGTKPLAKPFFWPLHAPGGVPLTRAWPMARENTATTDHFHQKSAWLCHGDVIPEGVELKTKSADKHVKGVDFWAESPGHGRIVCVHVGTPAVKDGVASVVTKNEWRTPDGVPILAETRTISLRDLGAGYLITVDTDLSAEFCPVTFGDTKEGAFGVRVDDRYRLAGKESKGVVTSSDGTVVKAPAKDDLPVWGRLADWHDYSDAGGEKPAGLAVFDAPTNPHRSAWHTRAYGLMAANPFGRAGSKFPARAGQTELVKLAKGEHLKLRYGLYAHTGDATTGKVAEAFAAFAK